MQWLLPQQETTRDILGHCRSQDTFLAVANHKTCRVPKSQTTAFCRDPITDASAPIFIFTKAGRLYTQKEE